MRPAQRVEALAQSPNVTTDLIELVVAAIMLKTGLKEVRITRDDLLHAAIAYRTEKEVSITGGWTIRIYDQPIPQTTRYKEDD